mgnify:CR=1 FL=1
MLERILQAALLAASAHASAWEGKGTRVIDENYNTILTTDVRVQINSLGTTLVQYIDNTVTLAAPASTTTETDAVTCVDNGEYYTDLQKIYDSYTCYHFQGSQRSGSDGKVAMYVFTSS